MQNWNHLWMGGFWIFPALMVVLMFTAIFVCARIFLPGNGGRPCCGPWQGDRNDESALDIAKRRYAAGEITAKEFEEIKKTIL